MTCLLFSFSTATELDGSLALVHCWDWPDLCKQENVHSYPTVHLYPSSPPTHEHEHPTLPPTPLTGALDSRTLLKAVGVVDEGKVEDKESVMVWQCLYLSFPLPLIRYKISAKMSYYYRVYYVYRDILSAYCNTQICRLLHARLHSIPVPLNYYGWPPYTSRLLCPNFDLL